MGIEYIDPNTINLADTYRRDVESQKKILERQGMIEPLEIDFETMKLVSDYPYANAQIQAAKELGWATVIVCNKENEDD